MTTVSIRSCPNGTSGAPLEVLPAGIWSIRGPEIPVRIGIGLRDGAMTDSGGKRHRRIGEVAPSRGSIF